MASLRIAVFMAVCALLISRGMAESCAELTEAILEALKSGDLQEASRFDTELNRRKIESPEACFQSMREGGSVKVMAEIDAELDKLDTHKAESTIDAVKYPSTTDAKRMEVTRSRAEQAAEQTIEDAEPGEISAAGEKEDGTNAMAELTGDALKYAGLREDDLAQRTEVIRSGAEQAAEQIIEDTEPGEMSAAGEKEDGTNAMAKLIGDALNYAEQATEQAIEHAGPGGNSAVGDREDGGDRRADCVVIVVVIAVLACAAVAVWLVHRRPRQEAGGDGPTELPEKKKAGADP